MKKLVIPVHRSAYSVDGCGGENYEYYYVETD